MKLGNYNENLEKNVPEPIINGAPDPDNYQDKPKRYNFPARIFQSLKKKKQYFLFGFLFSLIIVFIITIIEIVDPNLFMPCFSCNTYSFILFPYAAFAILALVCLIIYLLLSHKSRLNQWLLIIVLVLAVGVIAAINLQANGKLPINADGSLPINNNTYNGGENSNQIIYDQPLYKPVIYLYPTTTENIKVRLDFPGTLTASIPSYDFANKGWDILANPDGLLSFKGKEYKYLFWEGTTKMSYDLSKGFVVKGSDTKTFLQKTLKQIGLDPKEYNEMIAYWLPKMENSKYNLIHFAGTEYTNVVPLTVTPKPDSMLRVFLVFKPLTKNQQITSQTIIPFSRKGFSVIEWGGSELK